MKKSLLQIGELAKKCNISVQTLRYYDKIGFLKPDYIDEETGYRYYAQDKVFILSNTILLKAAGFSLNEIKHFFEKDTIDEVINMYEQKIGTIKDEIHKLTILKNQNQYYLDFFSKMKMPYADFDEDELFTCKIIESTHKKIISIGDSIVFDYPTALLLYNQLLKLIFELQAQVNARLISIFHSDYENMYHKKVNMELAMELTEPIKNEYCRELTYNRYVTALHKGKYPTSIETYKKMLLYISGNSLEKCGPVLHTLIVPIAAVPSPSGTVFEILIPVK